MCETGLEESERQERISEDRADQKMYDALQEIARLPFCDKNLSGQIARDAIEEKDNAN